MINTIVYAIKYIYYRLFGGFYELGWNVGFESGVAVRNRGYISLGSNIYLGKNAAIQVPEEHKDYGDHKPKLVIEDKVTIGMGTMISAAKLVKIEKNVMIGPNCYITDHNHKYTEVDKPIRFQGLDNVNAVTIGKDSWLGANATISAGVTIGKHCVVGANSVVTKDVQDYSVVVGSPAKVIKKYDFNSKEWRK